MKQFLLQMAGESGSGKSTLAAAIGRETGAFVLDKDIIKSRILDGDAEFGLLGLAEGIAAPLHWAILFDVTSSLLRQGFSVIIDGAAFFPNIRTKGQAMAEAVGAAYYLIECDLPDLAMLQSRIGLKQLMTSQPRLASLSGYARSGTAPITEPHLVIDTRQSSEVCLAKALEYLERDAS